MAEGAQRAALTARLFDADRKDRELPVDEALRVKVGDHQLLWLDAAGRLDPADARRLGERLELSPQTVRNLEAPGDWPLITVHKDYVHVRVATLDKETGAETLGWIDIVAADNAVLTVHDEPVPLLVDLDDRIQSDAVLGRIDATGFAAVVLDATVTTYFTAVDGIEERVDQLDARTLERDASVDLLPDLVDVRRRIARLRRVLTNHREVFAALARPDLAIASEIGDFASFPAVSDRFERAIDAVENSRDLLVGSFDVYMTRTAQRTNDVMKVLALASVLLLPGSLVAGLLGMNMPGPFAADDPRAFWIVVVAIAALAAATLTIARLRRWI